MRIKGHRDVCIGNVAGLNKIIGIVLRGIHPLVDTKVLKAADYGYVTMPPFKHDESRAQAELNDTWTADPTDEEGMDIAEKFALFLAGKEDCRHYKEILKVLREGLPLVMYKSTRQVSDVFMVLPLVRLMCWSLLHLLSYRRGSLRFTPASLCSSSPSYALA